MSNGKFPIDTAQIVGLFMERIFLVTFSKCLRVLVFSEGRLKSWATINFKMLTAAVLMFIFASMDVAFGLRHNIDAFIYFNGDPIDEFRDTSNWINVMKMVDYVAQTSIGDCILLYRCWIIYDRSYMVIIAPGLMWVAGIGCGIMTCYYEATITDSNSLLNTKRLIPFITSMLTLTLIMNVATTSFIVYRIWKIERALKHRTTKFPETRPLSQVMRVMIESGVMYTLSIIALFGLYMASNNGQFGVSDAIVQIIGITFNLMITRLDRGDATQPMTQTIRSHSGGAPIPLHAIHVQTTISRYPSESEKARADTPGAIPEAKQSEWE